MAFELTATERNMKKEKIGALRKKGFLPAVVYGKKEKSRPIVVSIADFAKVWKLAGESSVVSLKINKETLDCLIYEVDIDPIKDVPRHADFYAFEKGQKLKIKVPIEFSGVAPAVKDLGGVLVKVMHEVEIEAEPKDLPHKITVDVSSLVSFESQVLAKTIVLPKGVVLVSNPDEVAASVYKPKEEVVETAPAPDLSAIEVEKKGKKEEEGAEGGEAGKAEETKKKE